MASSEMKSVDPETKALAPSKFRNYFRDVKKKLHGVHDLHLVHRGSYSIERLKAFDEYCQKTSLLRVLGICIALPLPALAVAIGMEAVPLQDPKDGWRANHGAFIRNGIMNFMTAFGICLQSRQLIPNLSVSMIRMVLAALAHTLTSAGFKILVAEFWIFPTPYQYAWAAVPDATFIAIYFYLAIGRKQLKEKPGLPGDIWRQIIILMVAAALCIVYPAYNAVFLQLNAWQQTMFVFVLPMMKFALQNIAAWSTKHIVEYMPGVTVFSVEVFNALYLAKCMQSQGSMATFAAIMAFDVFESVVAHRDMKSQSTQLYELMKKYNTANPDRGFINTVLAVCQEPDVLSSKGSSIRIRSPIKLSLSPQSAILLDQLVRTQSTKHIPVTVPEKPVNHSNGLGNGQVDDHKIERALTLHSLTAVSPYSGESVATQNFTEINTAEQRNLATNKISSDQFKSRSTSVVQPDIHEKLHGVWLGDTFKNKSSQQTPNARPCFYDEDGSFKQTQASDSVRPSELCRDHQDMRSFNVEALVNSSELLKVADNFGLSPEELARLAAASKPSNIKFASRSQGLTMDEKVTIVNQALKLLFHCEYHALVEYMEAMVPVLYCVYVAVLTQLPSHVYYIEMRDMTSRDVDRMVGNIFAYAWMEIFSFIVMHFTIKWKFGFSPLYLLAFVLKNQFLEFQARLLVWFSGRSDDEVGVGAWRLECHGTMSDAQAILSVAQYYPISLLSAYSFSTSLEAAFGRALERPVGGVGLEQERTDLVGHVLYRSQLGMRSANAAHGGERSLILLHTHARRIGSSTVLVNIGHDQAEQLNATKLARNDRRI